MLKVKWSTSQLNKLKSAIKNKCLSNYIYPIATLYKVCLMFIKTGHLHLRWVFPIILVVKELDSQSRVPDSNLLGGFMIKVILAFHPVRVD